MRAVLVAVLVALAAPTVADDDAPKLKVELGKSLAQPVGIARGWFCDDTSLVTAEIVTRNEVNVWIVTGVKLGTTQCRVGTDPTRPAYVFEVRVVPAKPKR